jgi:tetratricopeptide (TPR) repeat protein
MYLRSTFKTLQALVVISSFALSGIAQQPNQQPKTWALVIGISRYQKLPGGQQLQFADRDASAFAEAIEKRGVAAQNVRLLTGAEATAGAIKSAIGNWLAKSAGENDTVLIFFSGHGFFEREFGESYLLGYDSDPKDSYGSALSLSELSQAFNRRIRAARVLLIADPVRRDFFDPDIDPASARAFQQAFEQLTASRPGTSAIIASGPGEFSREGQRWAGHGAFTKHLVDVLIDGAGPGGNLATTTDQLFELLKSRVADDTSNKQHPWRSGGALAQIGVAQQPRAVANTNNQPAPTTPPGEPLVVTKPAEGVRNDSASAVGENKTTTTPPASEKKPEPLAPPKKVDTTASSQTKPAPISSIGRESGQQPTTPVAVKQPAPLAINVKPADPPAPATPRPSSPAPAKPISTRGPTPPLTESVRGAQPPDVAAHESVSGDVKAPMGPSPPKPPNNPPSVVAVSSESANAVREPLSVAVPIARPEAAPSPLILQLEAAIASKNLIEPKSTSAWDIYTRLASDPSAAGEAARLKPRLAEALINEGRLILSGDVRSDNVSDKVDEFKRAGQMLVRARSLAADAAELAVLEKLSSSEALISLQFYDEAERALTGLQSAKLAAVENALGLVYQGKLDPWRAERAFKRAIELDAKWAAPHYNLALLYRGQQNQESLAELESAVALDQKNVVLVAALGEEYFTRQQWKQAAEAFRKAVALKPSDDVLHTKLGHCLYSQGLQDEANREYQKARDLRSKQQ